MSNHEVTEGAAVLAAAQAEFETDLNYLNTASLGLPPRRVLTTLAAVQEQWRTGRSNPPDFDAAVARSRQLYAQLVGVTAVDVAVGAQVSAVAGLIAASLPEGSEVLVPDGDFTSIVYPFLAQAPRGVKLRQAPLAQLAEAVTSATSLVSVSAVQSADGCLADLDALVAACARTGTRIFLDTTQAAGWLPIDASRFAYTAGGGYKWLLAPRGTCFFTVRPEFLDDVVPQAAGWYAGDDRWQSLYGTQMQLAADARRFDTSPAWHCWAGQAAALELLTSVGPRLLHDHALGLANRFRAGVGLAQGDSAIVSLAVYPEAPARMAAAGIVGALRAGRLRLSFHLNNTVDDADRAAAALAGHLQA